MIGSGVFACLFIHKMSLARISLIGEQKGNIQLEHLARKDSCIWIPDSGISVSWMLIGHVISMENPWSSGCIGAEDWSRMWTSLSQGSEKLLVATWPFGLPRLLGDACLTRFSTSPRSLIRWKGFLCQFLTRATAWTMWLSEKVLLHQASPRWCMHA